MNIGLVFGGRSYEHEISIISAIVLKSTLKLQKTYIFIDQYGEFYLIEAKNMIAKYFSSKEYLKSPKLSLQRGGFYQKGVFGSKKLELDTYLDLIHGKDGEDGKLAGMFEFYDLHFIGPRLDACVLSFNKLYTKAYAKLVGVKTLDFTTLCIKESKKELEIKPPFILKPLRLGSSIGIGIVREEKDFNYAKDVAFEFDNELLIEPFLEDIREFNLAGAFVGGEFVFSMIEEPKKKGFYDFEQKYLGFKEELKRQEADISNTLKEKMQTCFKKIYAELFKGAIIRCDFFEKDGKIYLNEINPVPGSMAHYLFDDFTLLIDQLAREIKVEKQPLIDYAFIHSISGGKK